MRRPAILGDVRFAPPRPGHVPWSHPAAAGMIFGIAAAGAGAAPGWLLASLGAIGWRAGSGVIFALFVGLGWADMRLWEARPDPLAARIGAEVALSGRSDGRVLRVDDPPGAAVALAPAGTVPAGRVRVRGELVRPEGKRNPGGFDYRAYLERRGVTAQLFVDDVLHHAPVPDPRSRMRRALERGLPAREAALVVAMTLGVRDDLGELRDAFAAAGLAHVLALSGLHVGVLVAAFALLAGRLGARRYPAVLLGLAGFVALVGPSPSIVRASVMVGAVIATQWRGGGRLEPWTALSLAAVVTLAWRPSWLYDVGFQLSYLAVIGLLVFMGPALRALRVGDAPWWHPRAWLLGSAAVSVASQLPLGSLLMASFGEVPLLSPVANVLAIPVATALVPVGFATAVLGAAWPPLADAAALVARPLASLLIRIAEAAAGWPALAWGEVGPAGHAVYAVAWVALALCAHGRLRLRRAAAVWLAAAGYGAIPPQLPEIVFLDVGQGDAVLIRLPGRAEVLVDAGGTPFSDFDVGDRVVVPALRALGVDELELVVATHADTDHIEGLPSVLAEVPVHQVVVGVPTPGVPVYDALVAAAERTGTPVRAVRRGQELRIGDAAFRVLHPAAAASGVRNEDSVVLLFSWRGRPVALFPGDVSAVVERTLAVPHVPVLMAPHHGSRHSTSDALVRAARPKLAVVSVGRNAFGHPADEVLARLRAHGAAVRVTREAGAVRVSVADMLRP